VAGLVAAQIIAVQRGGPGEAVVQPDLVLDRVAAAVDVLHHQRRLTGLELMPEFLGQFPGQGHAGRFAEADPATGQEPVPEALDRT